MSVTTGGIAIWTNKFRLMVLVSSDISTEASALAVSTFVSWDNLIYLAKAGRGYTMYNCALAGHPHLTVGTNVIG